MFKDEIALRIESGCLRTAHYLVVDNYLDYLSTDELRSLVEGTDSPFRKLIRENLVDKDSENRKKALQIVYYLFQREIDSVSEDFKRAFNALTLNDFWSLFVLLVSANNPEVMTRLLTQHESEIARLLLREMSSSQFLLQKSKLPSDRVRRICYSACHCLLPVEHHKIDAKALVKELKKYYKKHHCVLRFKLNEVGIIDRYEVRQRRSPYYKDFIETRQRLFSQEELLYELTRALSQQKRLLPIQLWQRQYESLSLFKIGVQEVPPLPLNLHAVKNELKWGKTGNLDADLAPLFSHACKLLERSTPPGWKFYLVLTLIACLQEILFPDDYFMIERMKFHAFLNKHYASRNLATSFRLNSEKEKHDCSLRLLNFIKTEKKCKKPLIVKTFSKNETLDELTEIFLPKMNVNIISVEEWGKNKELFRISYRKYSMKRTNFDESILNYYFFS